MEGHKIALLVLLQIRMMHHGKFYGSTVMGERGQVVIPAEAREEIGIKPGEKLTRSTLFLCVPATRATMAMTPSSSKQY